MMYSKNLLLLAVLTFGLSLHTFAQRKIGRFLQERIELGIHAGTSGYIGELNNTGYGFNSVTGGASVKYYFNTIASQDRTWGLRLDYNFIQLEGDDRNSNIQANIDRNLTFKNTMHEAAALAEFQFFEFRPNRTKNLLTPYVFAGLGMVFHNPKSLTNGLSYIDERIEVADYSLGENGETTYVKPHSKAVLTLPFGTGFKYNLSGRMAPWTIAVEANYRYAFSGFLDGVNKDYIKYEQSSLVDGSNTRVHGSLNQQDWENMAYPALNNPDPYSDLIGTPRGTGKNDWYMSGVLKLTYTFYKWRDPLWK